MTRSLCRRRFLTITACAVAAGGSAQASTVAWRGTALGAEASIRLGGNGRADATETFAAVAAEVSRLEDIFSLYRPVSQISVLNRNGYLDAPAPDFTAILGLCDAVHDATGGAFDPTIQPLWRAIADGNGCSRAKQLIGWTGVDWTPERIAFKRLGMAITLNGIAQGYITDRIAALLERRGYGDVLIDMGEIAALGQRSGADWTADIAHTNGQVVRRVTLLDRCLATSAPLGSGIGGDLQSRHILDPRCRPQQPTRQLVAVSASQAAVADGLSTGCCLLSPIDAAMAVSRFDDAILEVLV